MQKNHIYENFGNIIFYDMIIFSYFNVQGIVGPASKTCLHDRDCGSSQHMSERCVCCLKEGFGTCFQSRYVIVGPNDKLFRI